MATLLWKELTEIWRSYRLLVTVAVLVAFGIFGPVSTKYLPVLLANMADVPQGLAEVMPAPDITMAVTEYSGNLAQFGVILAILVPMAAVVAERTSGTAEITLSKPVSRGAFLLAKFLAYSLAFAASVTAAGLAGYYYIGVLFDWIPASGFLALNALILIYLLVLVALMILTGTLARSQLAAAGIAVAVLAAFGLLGSIPSVGRVLPGALLDWGNALALGQQVEPSWAALALACALGTMCLLAAWLVFRQQEL